VLVSTIGYNLDVRILVAGDRYWNCADLAKQIVSRLLARYGQNLVIIHGGEPRC
jgi:hypothetical protein